jgi:hypothetical protein
MGSKSSILGREALADQEFDPSDTGKRCSRCEARGSPGNLSTSPFGGRDRRDLRVPAINVRNVSVPGRIIVTGLSDGLEDGSTDLIAATS